ncbi:MAG: LemA family protein [Chitinophagales bacterium]|nr:LemA family protein [Bacteroidota bacterium]MCB9256562.1 LemA family protein [Chitinophagales bacterium]
MTSIYLAIFFLALSIAMIVSFNKFIKLRNLVKEAWSLIDVQLKLRYELIPNLVNTVKAYTTHEQNILRDISALRAKAMESSTPNGKSLSEGVLSDKLAQLMITIENYPELKADQHFLKLQEQLYTVENQIQMARRYYNGAVRNNNIAVQSFPANLLAAVFNFKNYDFFELDSLEERKSLELSFQDEVDEADY